LASLGVGVGARAHKKRNGARGAAPLSRTRAPLCAPAAPSRSGQVTQLRLVALCTAPESALAQKNQRDVRARRKRL
jgi:hypothetical protein